MKLGYLDLLRSYQCTAKNTDTTKQ